MLFHIQGLINETEKRRKGAKFPKIAETDEDKRSMMRLESVASKSKNILGYRIVLV
jgi:hypothetical protein